MVDTWLTVASLEFIKKVYELQYCEKLYFILTGPAMVDTWLTVASLEFIKKVYELQYCEKLYFILAGPAMVDTWLYHQQMVIVP